jgi:hypothetical protein
MPKKEPKLVFDYNNNIIPPAPFLEVSFLTPILLNVKNSVASHAIIDSGASISVIPKSIVVKLELKYIDVIETRGFRSSDFEDNNKNKGEEQKSYVYPIVITIESLGNFITKVITWDKEYSLIGRDLLNNWLVLLNGPDKKFEISLFK